MSKNSPNSEYYLKDSNFNYEPQQQSSIDRILLNFKFDYRRSNLNLVKSIGKLLRNIYYEMNMMKRMNKHVIFSDSLGLDLELIHTVQRQDDTNSIIDQDLKSKIISQIDSFSYQNKLSNCSQIFGDKIIIPRFNLNPDKCYQCLIKNGICLNSIEVYNQSSIRGLILTLIKSNDEKFKQNEDNKNKLKTYLNKVLKKNLKNQDLDKKLTEKLDLVYVIWSKDDFKTWKYQASIQNNCRENFLTFNRLSNEYNESNLVKTHEFFIQNLDELLNIGENIKIILCHQIGSIVYSDTNNQNCYNFECAFKI